MWKFRTREDSLEFGLSFFLLAGAALGALFCNSMSESMKGEFLGVQQSLISASALRNADFFSLLIQVAFRRFTVLFLGFLFSAIPSAPWLFFGGCGYLGFSSAVMVCGCTMASGLLGLFRYLVLIFPQCLFYLPVFYLLAWWMPQKEQGLRPGAAAAMILMTAAGAAAESFVNPWLAVLVL